MTRQCDPKGVALRGLCLEVARGKGPTSTRQRLAVVLGDKVGIGAAYLGYFKVISLKMRSDG